MPNGRNDDRNRRRDRDDDRGGREELRSVCSPGIGGGTGGQWDRGPWERDRGGDELRFTRGGEGGGGWREREELRYSRDDDDWSPGQTGVERTARGWGGEVGRSQDPYRRSDPGPTRTEHRGFAGRGPMNYSRPDSRILEDVCDRLTEDDEVDGTHVEVKVDRGEVTLTGQVASRPMKRRAEELAEMVPGVKDVHNQLTVKKGN